MMEPQECFKCGTGGLQEPECCWPQTFVLSSLLTRAAQEEQPLHVSVDGGLQGGSTARAQHDSVSPQSSHEEAAPDGPIRHQELRCWDCVLTRGGHEHH